MKKNGKKTESKNDVITEMKEEFKRHTTALMEHMTKEVKTVAEGHSILVKKLDKVESELGEVKNDLQGVKKDIHELKNDMAIVKPVLEMHTADLREIKSELGSVKMIVVNISHEIKDHDTRIKKVEEKVLA